MLVVGKYDKRGTRISLQDIEDAIKHKVVGEIVLDQLSATLSVNQGAPLVSGDRTKPLAQAYLTLAARVRKELMPAAETSATGPGKQPAADDKGLGRLGRLFGSGGN